MELPAVPKSIHYGIVNHTKINIIGWLIIHPTIKRTISLTPINQASTSFQFTSRKNC